MTYEQLLEKIRANTINFAMFRDPYTEQFSLVPFYNVLITESEHKQILDVLREQNVDLACAIMLNRVEVCIDQAGHAPHHYYVGDVQRPSTRCRACERIREEIRPKSLEEWQAHTVMIVRE